MIQDHEQYITVHLAPVPSDFGSIEPESYTVSGPGIGYKVNTPDLRDCVKVYQGTHTRIFPLSRVLEIEINL